MAKDNAAQAIKYLQKNLDAADKKLKDLISGIDKLTKKIDSGLQYKANLSKLISDYDEIRKKVDSLSDSVDKLNKKQEKQNKQTKDEKSNVESLIPSVKKLAAAFGLAFSVRGLAQFGKKLIETRGEFELQQVALRSILQNKQLADEIWDKTMQAALQSPFTAMQLTRYTKQLAAYRIETAKLFETTKRLADVSAGLGVDMQRLILAYGQVKSANYLRASEIRQFTEAGVNVLGELRDYFNEVKGMSVDTAKVMDMVQKRLVTFEDVEAIFKRMTDQGGIFYDMQRVQSQTVKGQINKLHDAYDQMLNSMGKANEGTLKNFVAALNNIVKNWRSWAVAIKSIAWGTAIGWISKYAMQLSGLQQMTEKTAKSFQKLKTFFATNWPQLAVAGVTTLIATFVNLDKKMQETNKEIDEQTLRLYETRKNFEDLKSKIENNNNVIKDTKSSTADLSKAQKENDNIMKKLNDEYPQLASQMEIAKNGIVEMNGALDINIRKLNEQMTILNGMKQSNWFSDSDLENLKEWEQSLSRMKMALNGAQLEAENLIKDFDIEINQGKTLNEQEQKQYEILQAVAAIKLDGNILDAVEAFKKLNEEFIGSNLQEKWNSLFNAGGLYKMLGLESVRQPLKANWSQNRVMDVLERTAPTLQKAYQDAIMDYKVFAERINKEYSGNITEFIKNNTDDINNATKEGLLKANETIIKALPTQTAEMKNFLNRQLNILFGTTGIDYFATSEQETTPQNPPGDDGKSKIDAAWRRRINLLEEMKKRYDELSKSAYGYAKSEAEVRKAFEKSFGEIFKGTGINMSQIDFTSMEGMMKSTELALSKASGISDAVREEIMKKIDSYRAQITIDAQVRIREDFGRKIERALGDYELTLELDKLNLPKGLANELWGVDTIRLEDLRAQMSDMFEGLKDENGQLSEEAFKDYKKYLDKIDDIERKQQRERLKDYSKYLEAQYSDRVKLEMEYVRKLAGLEATSIPEAQKKDIREGLEKEFLEKSRKQDWEDFKGSEFYVQMMEDLEKQGSASLDVMRKKLLEMRDNAENLSPRALKEVIKALEKIDDIERSRNKPISRLIEASKGLKGQEMKNVFASLAANQETLALYEEQEKELERMIMLEDEKNRLEKQGVTLEQARANLSSSNEAVKAAQKVLDAFKSSGSKEDQTKLAILMSNLNSAQMSAELWQTAVAALSGSSVIEGRQSGSDFGGLSLSELKSKRAELKNQKEELQGQIDKEEDLVRISEELQLAWDATWESVKKWAQSITNVFDGVMDTIDYFGDSTSTLTAEWKEFGDTSISALTDLVNGIQAYQQANAAAEKAGWATGLFTANGLQLAMVVLGVIIKVVQAIAKLHDARIDKEIEQSKKRVDDLQKAYERLEKQIEKTFDTVSYMREFNKETQNLYEQIEEANRQIAAAQDYKSEDKRKEAVDAAEDAKQQALDALDEIKQAQIEVFGGIGENSYRSAAEGFVDAWKSAFLETGDGLQGLQDHFDEFLNDWFVKQATMRVTAKMLEPLFNQIDQAVDQYSGGGANVLMSELQNVREKFGVIAPQLSEALEDLAHIWGLEGEGSLSGLAAGIQGMTEEQANILEAYWNSVRGYTANIDMNVARIVDLMTASGGRGVDTNPQLQQIELIAHNTSSINTLLQSVTKSGHTMGGMGLKVFVN